MNQWKDNARYLAAREIVVALRTTGHQAYFAGGCVRDLLLGLEPQDFDVATSATPDVVMGMFEKTYSVGAHFGVVLGLLACCGRVWRSPLRSRRFAMTAHTAMGEGPMQ